MTYCTTAWPLYLERHGIEALEKTVLRRVFQSVKRDCRSTTGENRRNIMKLTQKTDVDDIVIGSTNGLVYNPIPHGEEWKVDFAEAWTSKVHG